MPRVARVKDDYAVYHIMVRGNNKEDIFFSDADRVRFLETLKRYKEKYKMIVYAYCLMTNHIHLMIYANGQDISKIMQGINLSYTLYVNRTRNRCGHLFQGRFKSIIVKNDTHALEESRYIHNNPVRAGITKTAAEYEWSSINFYIGKKDRYEIIDTDFILKMFSNRKSKARQSYVEFVNRREEEKISEIEDDVYVSSDVKPVVETVAISDVLTKVSGYFNICVDEILHKGNKYYAKEKQVAAYFVSLKSKLQYSEIGRKFGICASAVGHNIKKGIKYVMANRAVVDELMLLF